ncbi:MAG: amino acid adenylation domain-containing protein, partial [Verrucomicrobiae bacterium]|nr:amino acid adenylation domain-containing protein [Verrucomicrobiae bacterium]
ASPLPELPLQVLDCAIAQRAEVESHAMRAQLEVWRRRLADPPAALELPFDHPRSTGSHFAGAREPLRVSGDLLKRLQTLATQNGSTLYMVLLAAFQSFLHRYTDQDDVLIGSPVSGRPAGCEELVGFFVNTLVLRADFSRDPSFRDAIRQARARALEAFSNADAPFEKIVEILRPERDLGRTPLFQAMFALQNTPPAVLELSGLRVTPLTTPHPAAMFDLTLSLRLSGEELDGYLEYGSDRFERDTVRRLGAAFVEFLRDASESPDLKLAELLPGRRERQTLAEWNSTRAEFPAASYPELFRRQAAETPNAAAVAFRGRMLSYHALDDASDELARELVERGVGPETPVGVCLERSLELAIALLAILKAGGAYLPLDPQYPRERLAFMIENSGARLALTATGPASALPQSVPRRYVDHPAPWKSPGVRLPEVSPDALAYLIYTSGSTGRPKGVAIEHRALVNHNLAIGRAYQLGPADRVLQFASLSFDISVEEIFATWLAGATLVMRTEECVRSMPDFFEFLKAEEITVLNAPTAFWHEMAPSLGQLSLPAALRLVVIGGEKASEVHYKTWRGRVPQRVRLLNAYGPTEATVTATVFAPGKGAPERLPIGRPIANTQAHVLDRRGRVLPVGAAGEICIGGAGLARGYWREPKLTAEKFVAKGGSGERVYRTGDRGRFLP